MEHPIAKTPEPPYYAVVFTSQRTAADDVGYQSMSARMMELATQQPEYLGIESARDENGVGITVSYWRDFQSIRRWREVAEHRAAQKDGRAKWYRSYQLRISRVEQDYGFSADA